MFRIQLDVGVGKVMVIALRGGLIHYFNERDDMLVIMGPLQPGEVPESLILLEEEDHE